MSADLSATMSERRSVLRGCWVVLPRWTCFRLHPVVRAHKTGENGKLYAALFQLLVREERESGPQRMAGGAFGSRRANGLNQRCRCGTRGAFSCRLAEVEGNGGRIG